MPVVIEKLVFGGQGFTHSGETPVFLWNALPGEEVDYHQTHRRRGTIEGIAEKILVSSPTRIEPRESHFLSCSPWQIMTDTEELVQKVSLARETYHHLGRLTPQETPAELSILHDANRAYGYRNKMEYSFVDGADGKISFAFFDRASHHLTPVEPCLLAESSLTTVAITILDWLRARSISARLIKTLVLRSSTNGDVIAGLFVIDEYGMDGVLASDPQHPSLIGWSVIYSDPRSPVSIVTKELKHVGERSITSTVGSISLSFGLTSFFQVNIPLFDASLSAMRPWVDPSLPVIDFYSGVGSIGLNLASQISSLLPLSLIESHDESASFAETNAEKNLHHAIVEVIHAPAEKMIERILSDRQVILDPPRAGLHPKVLSRLNAMTPPRILYLSCNIATQARDLAVLKERYNIVHLELFNYFPRTPHIESLAVLIKKSSSQVL